MFEIVNLQFLLTPKKCNYGKKKSHLKSLVNVRASKLSQLGHFLSKHPFNGGYFSSMVSASAYERCPLTEGLKYRILVEHYQDCSLVPNYRRCPLAAVRLYTQKKQQVITLT